MCVRPSYDCAVSGILQHSDVGQPRTAFARAASNARRDEGLGIVPAAHALTFTHNIDTAHAGQGGEKSTAAYLLPMALCDLRWVSFPQFAEMEKHATCDPPVVPQESCEGKKRQPGREDPTVFSGSCGRSTHTQLVYFCFGYCAACVLTGACVVTNGTATAAAVKVTTATTTTTTTTTAATATKKQSRGPSRLIVLRDVLRAGVEQVILRVEAQEGRVLERFLSVPSRSESEAGVEPRREQEHGGSGIGGPPWFRLSQESSALL